MKLLLNNKLPDGLYSEFSIQDLRGRNRVYNMKSRDDIFGGNSIDELARELAEKSKIGPVILFPNYDEVYLNLFNGKIRQPLEESEILDLAIQLNKESPLGSFPTSGEPQLEGFFRQYIIEDGGITGVQYGIRLGCVVGIYQSVIELAEAVKNDSFISNDELIKKHLSDGKLPPNFSTSYISVAGRSIEVRVPLQHQGLRRLERELNL